MLAQQARQGPPPQPLPHPELPEPVLVVPGPEWWVYAAAALLVLILLALVVWLLLRPARAMPPPMKKPYLAAMNRLREILAASGQQPPAKTAAEVSETLRLYFLDRYKIPAPFRTTHELFDGSSLPATSHRLQRYAPLASLWDQLAFAPVPADAREATDLVQKAIRYLEEDRA
ncbi:MAG: DUF4381 family protein [Prosthecobacter sp.]|nr:DUF4381 family protein [Prosthecobacter sp.]